MTGAARVRRWRAAAVLLALGALGAASGCSAARDELGTTASNCYVAIPVATQAVHHDGHLVGVNTYSLGHLPHGDPLVAATARRAHRRRGDVCAVAFRGHFALQAVDHGVGSATGPVAIVVVDLPSTAVLGTVVTSHLDVRYAHTHLGA